mgnify:CR=1 FL=1
MLKALFWRMNFFLKNRKSAKISRQLGDGVKSVIVESKNGTLAVDPRDLEVSLKLRNNGSYGLDEIARINELISTQSNVLVVGAHIGSLVIPIAKNCNKVVAIEANPDVKPMPSSSFTLLVSIVKLEPSRASPIIAGNPTGVSFTFSTANEDGLLINSGLPWPSI